MRDDRRQQRVVGAREVAGRRERAADAARDRRAHFGEAEIELRVGDGRIGRLQIRARLLGGRACIVELFLRRCVRIDQRLHALELHVREVRGRARPLLLRARAIERDPVRARIDLEQHRALRDEIALLVCNALQIAADARPQLDSVDRFDASVEFVRDADRARRDGDDADFGQRMSGRFARAVVTARQRQQQSAGRAERRHPA